MKVFYIYNKTYNLTNLTGYLLNQRGVLNKFWTFSKNSLSCNYFLEVLRRIIKHNTIRINLWLHKNITLASVFNRISLI